MPSNFEKIAITVPAPLLAEIDTRGDARSTAIARDLGRYYGLLARDRAALRAVLDGGAVGLLADALNGTRWDPQTIPLLPQVIADALAADGLAGKWGVDGASLLTTLRALSATQLFALADAIERFWAGPYHQEAVDWAEVLR